MAKLGKIFIVLAANTSLFPWEQYLPDSSPKGYDINYFLYFHFYLNAI